MFYRFQPFTIIENILKGDEFEQFQTSFINIIVLFIGREVVPIGKSPQAKLIIENNFHFDKFSLGHDEMIITSFCFKYTSTLFKLKYLKIKIFAFII